MPLHTLTLAAFYLGQAGTAEEDLFGMVAILLCLLFYGLEANSKVEISLDELLDNPTEGCSHREMTPFELSEAITERVSFSMGPDSFSGWQLFSRILYLAECPKIPPPYLSDDEISIPESTDDADLEAVCESRELAKGAADDGREAAKRAREPTSEGHANIRSQLRRAMSRRRRRHG